MVPSPRRTRAVLALSFLLLSACADDQLEEVIATGEPDEWLICPPTGAHPPADTQMIGRDGGTLRSGASELIIPEDAVPVERRFTFQQAPSDTVGVIITVDPPAQLMNNQSATLRIDMSRCEPSAVGEDRRRWSIWRIRRPAPSQRLQTDVTATYAEARIDSTSGFMIAN